jgi:hypothetical protein
MTDEITGDWDELVNRHDLRGRRVRVIVLDEQGSDNPWLKSLRAWANSHKPLGHEVDDSRESIYTETVDDPR